MGGGVERAADPRRSLQERRRELLGPAVVGKARLLEAVGHEQFVVHELRERLSRDLLDDLRQQ
ncbi:hypothetical protein FQZ97_1043320 [compost metagenome]